MLMNLHGQYKIIHNNKIVIKEKESLRILFS